MSAGPRYHLSPSSERSRQAQCECGLGLLFLSLLWEGPDPANVPLLRSLRAPHTCEVRSSSFVFICSSSQEPLVTLPCEREAWGGPSDVTLGSAQGCPVSQRNSQGVAEPHTSGAQLLCLPTRPGNPQASDTSHMGGLGFLGAELCG
ncbi:hypothetical protein AAFF_G00283980 [Aldrovandia affinis]|uniref:Uncharacterized protein n=1 Tax=Aldrovandia affinis TaxID=143900 RepID=A0AAD7TBM0_9TELE|nr:hypothetical protein AAFF_G00283980 [Aldrovandia affinis]